MADLPAFGYARPETLEELTELLSRDAAPTYLSGGTDLLLAMRAGKVAPSLVIDLKGLPGLCGIRRESWGLWIGALTPVQSLRTNPLVGERATALRESAQYFASWQVRNRATLGGNLGNGAPTADSASPLVALGAEIVTWSPFQARRIAAADFWLGAGKTILEADEIITAVEIPLQPDSSSAYIKLGPREAMDIAIAGAAVWLRCREGIFQEVRIALGGAGATPVRARAAESFLRGRAANCESLAKAGELALEDSNPRTSKRATREYRLAVIPVLVERALRLALERQRNAVPQ
jgi:CO/xanthine dehydrogenase FAD-binding subunit